MGVVPAATHFVTRNHAAAEVPVPLISQRIAFLQRFIPTAPVLKPDIPVFGIKSEHRHGGQSYHASGSKA